MIKRYNNLSFVFGVPGLVLQVIGTLQLQSQPHAGQALLIGLAGTVFLLIGFAYYAKAIGRRAAWCLMALLPLIGLIGLACLKDKSHLVALQQTTSDRPFVIHKPVVGFVNLQGDRGSALVRSDSRELSPFFARCLMLDGTVLPCHVLFLYCTIDPSGRIEGKSESLRGLAQAAGAYITVVATENPVDAYKKALEARVDWNSNLVLILDRKGPAFTSFFRRLFEKMNNGTSMLTAWVELAPQIPGHEHPDGPESVMLAEAGHVTFGKT